MKHLLAATLLMVAAPAFGQYLPGSLLAGGDGDNIPAAKAINYFVIYSHPQVDPTRSYAMLCGPDHPDCNTVYVDHADDTGFVTLDDALDFLREHQDYTLIRLVRVTDVPVRSSTEIETEHHPDTAKKTKVYSIK